MTDRTLGSLVIKMLGIYALLQTLWQLQYLSSLIELFTVKGDNTTEHIGMALISSLPILLSLVVGIVLIVAGRPIARVLFRQEREVLSDISLSAGQFQAICFSAVGVFVFLHALPQLCGFFMRLHFLRQQKAAGHFVDEQFAAGLWWTGITIATQCALALILFFGSKGLANLWHCVQIARYTRVQESKQM